MEVQPDASADATEQDEHGEQPTNVDNVHAQHSTDPEAFYVELSIEVAIALPCDASQSLLIALHVSGVRTPMFAEAFRQNLFHNPSVVFVADADAFCPGQKRCICECVRCRRICRVGRLGENIAIEGHNAL